MRGPVPTSFEDEREQAVYEMAICLTSSRWASKGLYDRAVKALGHIGITDVITLMGYYTSVAMTLAFYDVRADALGMTRWRHVRATPPRSSRPSTAHGCRKMLRCTIGWRRLEPDAASALFAHIRKPASYISGNTASPKNSRSGAKSKKAT
jgi:hypothetical protein